MKKLIFNIISIILLLVCLLSLTLISYYIFKLRIIPRKYLITGYLIIIIFILLLILGLFSKDIILKIMSMILLLIIIGSLLYITLFLNKTYHFLDSLFPKYETLNYNVIVKNDSNYNQIVDLNNKKISYINDNYNEQVKKELLKKIEYTEDLIDNTLIYDKLFNNETDAIILEEGYLLLAKEEIEAFDDNTRIVYSFKIKVKSHKEDGKTNLTNNPFILYISGIDQWGNVNSVRGRSDVNQIIVVNPKTNHILIVNTPRDYYVRLAGTTGLRDKLTHAGIYGIDKSIATLENLYDIDIDHYVRINFDSLVKVVDLIGGIDIYSDITFNSYHIKGWTVQKGLNHFNGREALAYARERYAYVDGDHHRGRNQQQVIEAIIDKLTNTNTILNKYNSLLNSLDGSFQTDIDTSSITSFIRYQIDKNPSWNVETIQANGFNSWGYTYSMGYNYYLWVMEPDWDSVNLIKNKISEVLNEN